MTHSGLRRLNTDARTVLRKKKRGQKADVFFRRNSSELGVGTKNLRSTNWTELERKRKGATKTETEMCHQIQRKDAGRYASKQKNIKTRLCLMACWRLHQLLSWRWRHQLKIYEIIKAMLTAKHGDK
jgi:hypothetical protein